MIYVISEILVWSNLEEAFKAAVTMSLQAKRSCISVHCLKLPSLLLLSHLLSESKYWRIKIDS